MSDVLLRLLGVRAGDAGSVVSVAFECHPAVGGVTWTLLAGLALVVAVMSYRRRDVALGRGPRGLLLGLRLAALAAVLGILLRPGLGLGIEGQVRQTLVLLLDQSASLQLRDPRVDPADQVRAGLATGRLPATGGLNQRPVALGDPAPSRLELLRAAITNREIALLERLEAGFEVKVAGFADDLIALGMPEGAAGGVTNAAGTGGRGWTAEALAMASKADGRRTAPGVAIREVLRRERGRPLGGMILFTDGIRNAGPDPREVASLAREAGVVIHTVGLGTTAPRDVQVVEVTAPEVAFLQDEVPVNVRVRARGLAGQTVRLGLSMEGMRLDERDVRWEADGDQVVGLKLTPEQTGDFELTVDIPARPDEILAENNRQARRLRVVDDRVRVLLLEESPRWEFRYLQALLLRDRRVELKCVLFDADPAVARSPGSPYLESFPTRREDLFGYDLIVFGDVDPRHFTPAQLEMIADFVARSGGSFLMVAGRRYSPWGYRDTALERLLPVEFERPIGESPAAAVQDRPIPLALTPEGRSSVLLRMADELEVDPERWQRLPPLFWVAPVKAAKAAAQVLMTDARSGEDGGGRPVVVLQQYGVGQSMFVGTDNTWRWRRNEGEAFYESFWARVIQRLSIHHLVSGSRRTQLTLDQQVVGPGERVSVSARLFTSSFEPLTDPGVLARVEADGLGRGSGTGSGAGPLGEVTLRAVPDQPGLYEGELVAPAAGKYRLRVGDEAPASVDFTVEDRRVEAGETAMQEGVLRELAQATGGVFFREEDLVRLPEVARSQAQRVISRLTVEIWSSPLYYLGILLLLTAEWLLRKWWQVK